MTQPSLQFLRNLIDEELKKPLIREGFSSKRLNACINYSLQSPGKRLRPMLVLACALTISDKAKNNKANHGAVIKKALPAALAVEYVHTYSLIHDDLPSMDNDDYRRGRLSAHRKFDEGLAILAGDALLADAFYLLAKSANNAAAMCQELALTAGRSGLTAGQAEDLNHDNNYGDNSIWLKINQAKTARLFESCASLGALSVNADKDLLLKARRFGQTFGILFQIKDDQDDEQGSAKFLNQKDRQKIIGDSLSTLRDLSAGFGEGNLLGQIAQRAFANLG